MFSRQTYIERRNELKKLVGNGIIVIFGNNEAPCNYPANAYYPFRQDSTFLYYFGQQRDGLVGVIDIDNDRETLIGNDIDIEDIVWYGSVDSVADLAEQVGIHNSAPMSQLKIIMNGALRDKRTVHFLPPYRHDIQIQIFDLLGIHPSQQKEAASLTLIKAVVKMRSRKTAEEIDELERAAEIGYQMHTTAMKIARPGLTEKYVGGQVDGIAHSLGAHESFATIFSQHGEIKHGNPSTALLAREDRLGDSSGDESEKKKTEKAHDCLSNALCSAAGGFRLLQPRH
jgi:Xaa-Pro aminopeptidase